MHETDAQERDEGILQTIPLIVTLAAEHDEAGRIASRETSFRLQGTLHLPKDAIGIVLFVTPGECGTQAGHSGITHLLWQARMATVDIDLLDPEAAHFTDAATHLPLLVERLLAVIGQLTRLMESDVIPARPIGLFAAGDATPVAVRAAAVRDKAVAALLCVGGLVDLAGLQYLRELKAPLLMLAGPDDAAAANLARARPHIPGRTETRVLPEVESSAATAGIARTATTWFSEQLLAASRRR